MPKRNKFNGSINKPFFPEKKQDDKKARIVAIVFLLILAFCCFGSVLAIGLTVKDCTIASAEVAVSEQVPVPEGYPNLIHLQEKDYPSDFCSFVSENTFTCQSFYNVEGTKTISRGIPYKVFLKANTSYTSYISFSNIPSGYTVPSLIIDGYATLTPFSVLHVLSNLSGEYSLSFSLSYTGTITDQPVVFESPVLISVGLWEGDFSNSDFASSVYYQAGLLQGQTDGYKLGYNEGYSNGYTKGESSISESLGFFQSATVTCGSFTDFSSWDGTFDSFIPCPSSFYVPYYSGLYFKIYGDSVSQLIHNDTAHDFNIISFYFGLDGKSLNSYAIFNVVRWVSDNNFYSTGEYGSGCTFYFADGKSLDFATADGFFSYIDLTSYLYTPVRRITFYVSRSDIRFFGLTSNPSYNNAYNSGFLNGKSEGYTDGFSNGKNAGYSNGYSDGVNAAGDYTFLSLLGSVIDAPLQAVSGMLNFNLLGFNMLNFFYALLTCALVIAVIRLIL